ncbi:MAG: hypothetical protein K2O12_05715, partial [Muribaculaceae bacterium]|nr:hypothetical protein [Muribaculaceae bacterium]
MNTFISVNSTTGEPISDTRVILRSSNWANGRYTWKQYNLGTTDRNGILKRNNKETLNNYGYYIFSNGGHKYRTDSKYISGPSNKSDQIRYNAAGYTSLGIYRPGDTVDYTFIITETNNKNSAPVKRKRIRTILYDTNYQPIDTITGRTDDFGRIEGKANIPNGSLTGYHTLETKIQEESGSYTLCGNISFMVSDYKMPQFKAEVTEVLHDCPSKGDITLCGKAATYSGFPIANAKVAVGLSSCERGLYWYEASGNQITSTEICTDEEGYFKVTFDKALLDSSSKYAFKAVFDVTSSSGETQSCHKYFTQGSPYIIRLDYYASQAIDISSPTKIAVSVLDDQYNPVDKFNLTYTLSDRNKRNIKSGTFDVSDTQTDWSTLPQGTYTLTVAACDSTLAETAQASIILYNP